MEKDSDHGMRDRERERKEPSVKEELGRFPIE